MGVLGYGRSNKTIEAAAKSGAARLLQSFSAEEPETLQQDGVVPERITEESLHAAFNGAYVPENNVP